MQARLLSESVFTLNVALVDESEVCISALASHSNSFIGAGKRAPVSACELCSDLQRPRTYQLNKVFTGAWILLAENKTGAGLHCRPASFYFLSALTVTQSIMTFSEGQYLFIIQS